MSVRNSKADSWAPNNGEDGCTGRFWEGRFKSIALHDEAAILACLAYVDLNPIRAGLAESPETSAHTSAQDRIVARQAQRKKTALIKTATASGHKVKLPAEIKEPLDRAGWLCPFRDVGRRQGFLDMDLDDYLELLDWTGRQIVENKRGAIPAHLKPILTRLEIEHEQWLHSSRFFGTLFYRVAGTVTNMAQTALETGQRWSRGMEAGKRVFMTG